MIRLALKNLTSLGGATVVHADAGAPVPVRGLYGDSLEVSRLLQPEVPVFCFSPTALRARIGAFLDGFPGKVSYAVKANPGEGILLTVCAAGVETFDVASVEEMAAVRAVAPRARLHYHNPIKSRTEIDRALNEFGCRRFAADDLQEIAKIAAVAGAQTGIEVAVRFRLPRIGQSVHDFSTKFGAAPELAIILLKDVAARGFAPVLTFHPGSQCIEPDAYARHIAAAAAIAASAGVTLTALNVGGGFPAAYANSTGPALADYFAVIEAAVTGHFSRRCRPPLECEPGRGLVAPAVSLLTRVKLVKPCRREIFLNDGVYGALMEVSQVRDLMPRHRVIRDGRPLPAGIDCWTVYGPTCDPLDVLPGKLALADDIAEDDYVEFAPVGAYGAATSTRFNGYGQGSTVIVGQTLCDVQGY